LPESFFKQKQKPAPESVKAFLSCSVRPRDKALVDAMAELLREHHFTCVTPGRNVSVSAHPDDAVRQVMEECDCLIGIATARLTAADIDQPNSTLQLATPYLVQEAGAAHQLGMPFLVFKTEEIVLQGITSRNAFLSIKDELGPTGRPLVANTEMMTTALQDLRKRALARRQVRERAKLWDFTKSVVAAGVAAYGGLTLLEQASRPNCFGTFHHKAPECKECSFKPDCKAAKARDAG
jgi:hypothetical protein